MTYTLLGQNLYDVANCAKRYFISEQGAKKFKCEQAIELDPSLPLKPTWQAALGSGYYLCVEVRESPFSPSLYEFVTQCAARGLPILLWVALPAGAAGPSFATELRAARDGGIGVVQFDASGAAHYFHRPVSLSLFGLKQTDIRLVPKGQREDVKNAEATFRDGSPPEGCQAICQALEQITRQFAEFTYQQGHWRHPAGSVALKQKFFQTDSWAKLLETMETRLDIAKVKSRAATFSKQNIVKVRGYTDWRNIVSHKPKSFKELRERDAKLRTMFEATRDMLLEWYVIAKAIKLIT